VLSTPAHLSDPLDPDVCRLADQLVALMAASPGCVGIAAPQVGAAVRLFVLDVAGARRVNSYAGLVVLANPEVVERSGREVRREGCLSVPDLTGDVARATSVVVRGLVPGTGEERVVEADAFEARALQHELDHLDGLLFLDRVEGAHALFARKRYL
jgi:peptide deformylase